MLLRQTLLFLSRRKELEDFLRHNPTARQASRRFVAGETRAEALEAACLLNAEGFKVTLDYLGEEVTDADRASAATEEYAAALEEAVAAGIDTGISVKLSHLGVRIDEDLAWENLKTVTERALQVDRFVRVDMEGSDLTEVSLQMVRRAHRSWPNIGAVLQASLHRSDADLALLNEDGISVRLVKGAYLEPKEIALQDREEVDLYFMRLTEALVHSGTRPAFATHNEKLIEFVIDMADIFEVDRSRFEFQMLYGIGRDLQRRLKSEGYRVRIYLPYGEDWYGYFMRRLAERPANMMFLMRHLKH
ncbi:MAG: proline dehydrogenase [Desulfuromonas sp.]|uniref:proline dehydrogenase family protein n=1 Tax=Desulfuromonas sp. TaxID=892 RepID=UPI000CB8172C|nr:proline dehydrogenase family protein [Desulfuromonas sp.]PLX83326.1 MAG: proline dehydrogenase [Desulfuromonas sp.]